MGMYDSVIVNCPNCGKEHEFQSKSGGCFLDVYTLENCPDDVMANVNRHSPCQCDCGAIFQVDIEAKKAVLDDAIAGKFYRYEAVQYASMGVDSEYENSKIPNPKVELRTYNLLKETPKGYWIGHGSLGEGYLRGQGRWVSKSSKKRFAYPTKKEALENFIKRNERRLKILKYQLLSCEFSLMTAKTMSSKISANN